jgi:hypothetical protein
VKIGPSPNAKIRMRVFRIKTMKKLTFNFKDLVAAFYTPSHTYICICIYNKVFKVAGYVIG